MIYLVRDIFGISQGGHDYDGNLLDWLRESAPDVADKRVIISVNGDTILDTSRDSDADRRADVEVSNGDHVIVRVLPEGVELGVGAIIGIAAAVSVATVLLMPKPKIPGDMGDERTSPNNRLNAASNSFRLREAIPDISGEVVAYPDFLQRPYYEWDGTAKELTEVFGVGVGSYNVTRPRLGDGAVSGDVTVWQPNEQPAELLSVLSVDEASLLTLPAREDPSRFATVTNGTINIDGASGTITVGQGLIDGLSLQVGMNIRLLGTYISIDFGSTSIDEEVVIIGFPSSGVIEVDGSSIPHQSESASWDGSIERLDVSPTSEWFVLPGSDFESIRYQIEFPDGLRGSSGEITITLILTRQEIDANGDPIGSIISETEMFTANSPQPQGRTYEYAVSGGRWRARVTNASFYDGGARARQRVILADLEAVNSYSTAGFGDITSIQFERKTPVVVQQTRGSDKFNVLAQRLLPLFDPMTGTFGATREPTREAAQYVAYLLLTVGKIPLRDFDYESLFDIADSLPPELRRFDFTFDDKDVSLEERVATACNAMRVRVFKVGGVRWMFVRDEAKPVRSALFNRRNVAPNSVRETWQPWRSNEFDSIEIEYVDPITNAPAYVRRRVGASGDIEVGLGDRPQEMKLAGCRTEAQAVNRAEYEIRRMKYQRRTMTLTALSDGLNVLPGQRVGVADMNDSETFDGEILAVEGDVYRTSEKFAPESGKDYYVYITDIDGACSNQVPCVAVEGDEFAFEASGLTAFVADGYEVQVGSRYIIATAEDMSATDWVVAERGRPDEFNRVTLELVNYDERVYAED